MSDTLTAPSAPASDAPATPQTFADAAALLKQKGDSWGDDTAPEITPVDPAAVDAAVDAASGKPAEGETAVTEGDALAGFALDAEGRLHRPDGTYADASQIEAWNAGAAAPTPTEASPAETPEPQVITLTDRNGNEKEIEIDDPETAEFLNTLRRDSMRSQEYQKRMAHVQEKEAQYREFEAMIETNPESVVLQHLPVDKQVSLAVALIAQHWDQLAPHLVKFDQEPATRIAESANARARMSEQERTYEQRVQSARYATQLESAVSALVPATADEEMTKSFMQDAGIDLGNAIRSRNGAPIPIEEVRQVLSRRLALYGFDKTPAPATPTPKRPLARSVAAPKAPAAPAKDVGAQVRRTVTAQRVAAAVPPQGAGASTVRTPLVPTSATIEQASQALRKQTSWRG